MQAHAVLDNAWQEETLNGRNAPQVGEVIDAVAIEKKDKLVGWDMTASVATAMGQGADSVSFALVLAEGKQAAFYSKESADHKKAPFLVIISEPDVPDSNLLINGSFEEGVDAPTGWTHDSYNRPNSAFSWDDTQAVSGSRSIKTDSFGLDDAYWFQQVQVQPYADYRLTGWIKTENVSASPQPNNVGANLSALYSWNRSEGLLGTNDWTRVELIFNAGSSSTATIAARLGFYNGITTGVAWFDDLRLEMINMPGTSLQNPGFEIGTTATPDNWWTETIMGSADFTWDTSVWHGGSKSVKITTSPEATIARWYQTILVDPDSEYELSGWARTYNVAEGRGARLAVYGMDSYLASSAPPLTGTMEWTRISTRFITGRTHLAKVTCTVGEADPLYERDASSGTLWCDDFTLIRIRTLDRTQLAGEHMALDLYTQDYIVFDDPVGYLSRLDEAYESMAYLVNSVPFNGDMITVRSDASMYYALLSGNPITIGPGDWGTLVNKQGIDFGVVHELGHDFSPNFEYYTSYLDFSSTEHWANFKLLYAFDVIGTRYPEFTIDWWAKDVPLNQLGQRFVEVEAQPWIDSGRTDYQNMDHDIYTGLLYSLVQQVGWEPFIATFHDYSMLPIPVPPTDEAKVELMANLLSKHAGVNLIPTFQSWGFPVQEGTSVP